MQMLQKNPVNTRVVEKKTKIFNTGIRIFFKVLSCDMAEGLVSVWLSFTEAFIFKMVFYSFIMQYN